MAKTVIGLFDDANEAQGVVRDLVNAGFNREDISLAANTAGGQFNPTDGDQTNQTNEGGDVAGGALTGAGTGAVIGGIGGLVLGLGALAIPGVGPIVAAGPIASALTGAALGGVAGGLIGALTNIGVPEEEAHYYTEGVRRGGTLVAVRAEDNRAHEAAAILERYGAADVQERAETWRQSGWSGFDQNAEPFTADQLNAERQNYRTNRPQFDVGQTDSNRDYAQTNANLQDEQRLPVVEEELQVGKREVQRGGVRVYSHVTEEPVQEQVTLREEQVHVDRQPVNRQATEADLNTFREERIELTETAEEPVVHKQANVVEEVVLGKDVHERTETVQDTVRRTDVDVQNIGGGSDYVNDYRSDFQNNYATRGGDYNQYEPAYRYGSTLANDQRYANRDWNDVEMDARRDWETRNQGGWEDFKDAIRYGWERVRNRGSRAA